MSILCGFGDSIMKGVVYDAAKKKYSLLKDSFANTISDFCSFTTENFAKFGCTVTKGLEIVKKHTDIIKGSDYVALEFGGNDSDFNWKEIAKDPDAEHIPQTTLSSFEAEYADLINEVKAAGGHPVILNLPPIDAQKYFDWVSRGVNKENILKWLGGSEEYIYKWHEMYSLSLHKLSKEADVSLIDIRSAFLIKKDYKDYLCMDGIHPNEMGHALISETIESFLKENNMVA